MGHVLRVLVVLSLVVWVYSSELDAVQNDVQSIVNIYDENAEVQHLSVDDSQKALDRLINSKREDTQKMANDQKNGMVNTIDTASKEELDILRPQGRLVSEYCYIPAGGSSCAPQFIIAGSMKCGTTSLYSYLLNHPQVEGIKPSATLNGKGILAQKEIRFFNDPGWSTAISRGGLRGAMQDYFNIFERVSPPNTDLPILSGDATPMYVCKEGAGKRAYLTLPEAKVIIMVREPIDRLYSEFWFKDSLAMGGTPQNFISFFPDCLRAEINVLKACHVEKFIAEPLTIDSVHTFNLCVRNISSLAKKDRCTSEEYTGMCTKPQNRYCSSQAVRNSFYVSQIVEWYEMYGDRLLVINSDEFYENTSEKMEEIADFLGIDEFDWSAITKKAFNIVNPGTSSASGKNIVTKTPGLAVGASSAENTSKYPPLPLAMREEFQEFFSPLNEALARYLNRSKFWDY